MTTKNSAPTYVPSPKILNTPAHLLLLETHFFSDVIAKPLKLRGSLLDRMQRYIPTLLLEGDRVMAVRDQVALLTIDAFANIPFVKANYNQHRKFHTAFKKGSVVVNITKYCWAVQHISGIALCYTVLTTTEVLSGKMLHTFGKWEIEMEDNFHTAQIDHYIACAKKPKIDGKINPYNAMVELIFALTPYTR